jgi:CBS domain-containing protein
MLQNYIAQLSRFQGFKFVVFLDAQDRFIGYMPAWALERLLEGESGARFVDALNKERIDQLVRTPTMITTRVTPHSTKAEALREMSERGLEALVVVDAEGRLCGVVERDQLMSMMLLALTE